MGKVILGKYATPRYVDGPTFFGSDAFWEPNSGIFGVASSYHHYHLYPISERDVKLAFDVVRATLVEHGSLEPAGTKLLRDLLQAVHHSFAKIDIRAHINGIEFQPIDLPGFPEPADDPESEPQILIALLKLHRQRLSVASVGNFLIYIVRPTGHELIFGWDWFSNTQAADVDFFASPASAYSKMPAIHSMDIDLAPGDMIIATTHSLGEIIFLARLDQLVGTIGCVPEAANRHLIATLKSTVPEDAIDLDEPHGATKSLIGKWGAAWAITCVEG